MCGSIPAGGLFFHGPRGADPFKGGLGQESRQVAGDDPGTPGQGKQALVLTTRRAVAGPGRVHQFSWGFTSGKHDSSRTRPRPLKSFRHGLARLQTVHLCTSVCVLAGSQHSFGIAQ